MFWEVSIFRAGDILITTCTLNATGSLDAVSKLAAEAQSWPDLPGDEDEPEAGLRSYKFEVRLIPN